MKIQDLTSFAKYFKGLGNLWICEGTKELYYIDDTLVFAQVKQIYMAFVKISLQFRVNLRTLNKLLQIICSIGPTRPFVGAGCMNWLNCLLFSLPLKYLKTAVMWRVNIQNQIAHHFCIELTCTRLACWKAKTYFSRTYPLINLVLASLPLYLMYPYLGSKVGL